MALDFYNEEYNKPKVATPEITTTGTPSVSSAPEPTKAPIPIAEKKDEDNKGIGISKGDDSAPDSQVKTIEDEYYTLYKKKCEGTATEEELKKYEEIKAGYEASAQKNATATTETQKDDKAEVKKTPEQEKKHNEYTELYQESGTDYEKTSRVLDKYLTENNESYAKLKESYGHAKNKTEKNKIEQQMKKQRDKLIHDWQAVVNPGIDNSKLSVRLRQRGIREIGKIFAYAGEKGIKQDSEELRDKKFISDIKSNRYEIEKIETAIQSIDFEAAKDNPDKVIKEFAQAMLKDDAKYNSLTGEAQEKYLQEKIASTISDRIGMKFSAEELQNNPRIAVLKKVMVSIIKKAKENGSDINKILNNKSILADELIKNMKKYEEEINKLPENERRDAKRFLTHIIISKKINKDIEKDGAITERDIYNNLKKRSVEEKNLNEDEKDLLRYLERINKHNPAILNQEFDYTSAVSMSIVLGEKLNKIGERYSAYIDEGKTSNERITRLADVAAKFRGTNKASTILTDIITRYEAKNGSIEKELISNKKLRNSTLYAAYIANINLDANDPESRIAAVNSHKLLNKMGKLSTAEAIAYKNSISGWSENDHIRMGKEKEYRNVLSENKQLRSLNTQVVLANFSDNSIRNIQKENIKTGDKKFNTLYSQSLIESADPKRQISLSKELLSLHDSATTEGIAAAEQSVDSSVREEYSKALNNEINSGYYTTEQKANFQTARETGQTSFERTQSSEGAKSEASNLNNKTTSPISSSTPEAGVRPTKVTISTIYISQESKTYAREIKTTLAQLDSENKKAEAMKKAADNIAKIQKDAIEREYTKAEQQKIQEQKQAVETAQKENAKKSEEKLKSDIAKAVDTSIEEIKEELPASPEAAEVQKAFGEMFNELKAYAKAGQIDQVYSLLGKIPKAQEKFLEKLATKHISTITHFIKTADKAVIRQLCELNPSLIAVLDKSTLLEIGISKAKIIKYGDKDQIAGLLTDLQMSSTKDTLNEFYEIMGIKEDNPQDPAEAVKKNGNVNGGDDHMARLMQNMKDASKNNEIALSSNIVGGSSYRFPEGTKKKLDPKEFWG